MCPKPAIPKRPPPAVSVPPAPGTPRRPTLAVARRLARCALLLACGGGAAHGLAPPAAAQATVIVSPGESIQAAVDGAAPGTLIQLRPGTYNEGVVVRKSGITLQGAGITETILDGTGLTAENGIYVEDASNVTIENLAVRGFTTNEILIGDRNRAGSGGSGHVVRGTLTSGGAEYGIGVFQATGVRVEANDATLSLIGLYVGRMKDCQCVLADNDASGNLSLGILVAAVGNIVVERNVVADNNVGIFALQGEPGIVIRDNEAHANSRGMEIGATDGVAIYGNTVAANNRPSTEPADHPPGTGIALLGSSGARVSFNTITGHTDAGILAVRQTVWKGGTTSTDNRLCPNRLSGNAADLRLDAFSPSNRAYCIVLSWLGTGREARAGAARMVPPRGFEPRFSP